MKFKREKNYKQTQDKFTLDTSVRNLHELKIRLKDESSKFKLKQGTPNFFYFTGDTMMSYCNNSGGSGGTGGGANADNGGSPRLQQIPCSSSAAATPPTHTSGGSPNEQEEDVWRGHSIAALRRRASELNAAIPSYLQINYDTHNNASVY